MAIEFTDNSAKVIDALNSCKEAFLYEVGELLSGSAAEASPVASGQLKGSWDYKVDVSAGTSTIGSPLENAIWNEYGTGEYAVNGDGRKTPWVYKDANGRWHRTTGKKPRRTLQSSFTANKNSIIRRAEELFKERMNWS